MHALPSPKVASRILPINARALPLRRALLTPCMASAINSRRSFASSFLRRDEKVLQVAKTNEKSIIGPGAEGPHIKDLSPKTPVVVPSSTEELRGDWVLFHPVYSPEELRSVEVLFRDAKTFSDRVAHTFVKIARWAFDFASGYKHRPLPANAASMSLEELRKGGYLMDESQWLRRILFLESIAAVPGMVAAALRHLRSLRLMRRDHGWIHTLLEEAENERMHLMTFMTLKNPSRLFRAMVLGAQGVFYNAFFLCYLISPSTCHRFVGHLEEEAVVTYTRCIQEIEAGRLPEWTNLPAPEIAKDYWRLGPDAKFLDVVYAVRSDESTHRFVNHSLASLKYESDINPFALQEPDMTTKGSRICFERDESARFAEEAHRKITDRRGEAA
ncbi:alternative oxidase [Dichomitus squalens]|uniref:Alternative oxidase n=1 Tax=Dichomitus squalens TaxID=114155 RepID=A0A4Q9MLU8_9APHY|nr:alternative oxidase [Dichomitus squalens]